MADSKDKDDEKDKPEEVEYPEGQEYIRDIVKPYREKIWQLNEQIDQLDQKQAQEPQKHTMTFNPPGYLRSRVPPTYNRDILVGHREDVQQELDKRVGVEIKGLEPDQQMAVKESVRDDVDRNPFLGKSKQELDKFKEDRKDLSLSQNYNMMLLKNYQKEVEAKSNTKEVEQDKKSESKAPETSTPLASERFSRSLNYTRAVENRNDITERSPIPPRKSVGKDER